MRMGYTCKWYLFQFEESRFGLELLDKAVPDVLRDAYAEGRLATEIGDELGVRGAKKMVRPLSDWQLNRAAGGAGPC